MARGTVIQATSSAGPVTIDASAADRDGAVALVIDPRRPTPPPQVPEHWPLTGQQRQIVVLIAGGMSNRQIAESLFVSEHTVEWHIRQIFDRLDIRSRTQLMARYFREAVLGDYQDLPSIDAGQQ
jgi:DNA-binding NarL/FixJ family response regulator